MLRHERWHLLSVGEERFRKFQEGMTRLHDRAEHEGVRVVHVTPPVFDPVPLAGKTLPAGLDAYPSPHTGYNGCWTATRSGCCRVGRRVGKSWMSMAR